MCSGEYIGLLIVIMIMDTTTNPGSGGGGDGHWPNLDARYTLDHIKKNRATTIIGAVVEECANNKSMFALAGQTFTLTLTHPARLPNG